MSESSNPNGVVELLRSLRPHTTTVFELASELDTNGRRLTVEFKPTVPQRAESPPVAHEFHDPETFKAYLRKYGCSATLVLADVGRQVAAAVLDENKQAGFEVVRFRPAPHPLLAPWEEATLGRIPISELRELVMLNRRSVVEPDAATLALTFGQIRVTKNSELIIGEGTDFVNGLVVRTRIEGVVNSVPVELPDKVVIEAPIWAGRSQCERIEFDLLVGEVDGNILGTLSAVDLRMKRLAAFEQYLAELAAELPEGLVGLGSVEFGEWRYRTAAGAK